MSDFTHIDEEGHVKMVDVSEKQATLRVAVAQGVISMSSETFERIIRHTVKKGNVLETARIAGIMAAKNTPSLIPLCHPLQITHVQIDFSPDPLTHSICIEATVRIRGQTGVEMEALTAVSIAALTIYDMCKSYDRHMEIDQIHLIKKSGGKSGIFRRSAKKADR
jgi:cyclic pyranopterin phosphate synthase